MYHKTRICKDCDEIIVYNTYHAHYRANKNNSSCIPCGHIKSGKAISGANHPSWKGGVRINSHGYKMIYQGPHGRRKRYKQEHRIIFEKYLGRELLNTEVVHHEDEIRDNNDITNLILFNNTGDHRKWHGGNKTVPHIKGYDLK